MPEEIPEELQKEFIDLVDSCVYKTINNVKTSHKRGERKIKSQLILNQICNENGDELVDTLIGEEDVECNWDFLDTIGDPKLFNALKSLSEKELYIVRLKFYDDYSNDEICEILGYKHKSSCNHYIERIISKLRKCLI